MKKQTRLGFLASSILGLSITAGCVPKNRPTNEPDAGTENIPAGGNLLKNATFDSGAALPWTSSFTPPADGELIVKDGAACLTIENGGSNNWDAQVRHREIVIQEGHTYNVSFKIWADKPTMVRPKVGQAGPPYQEFWQQTVKVTTAPQVVQGGFVHRAPDDPTIEFALHMGG